MCTEFLRGKLSEGSKTNLEEREGVEKITSGLTFGKLFVRIRDACNWLRIVSNGGLRYWRCFTSDDVFTRTISNSFLLEPRARRLQRAVDINNASSCVAVHYGAMTS
jgi:hypothetical protein